jgi:hypothetical protein
MGTTPTITRAEFPGYTLVKDGTCDNAAEKDVMAGPCRLASLYVNNAENSASSYLKLYDDENPTVGTTVPDFVIEVPGRFIGSLPCNPPNGYPFSTGLSFAAVTAGGTAGTTSPSSSFVVELTLLPGVS